MSPPACTNRRDGNVGMPSSVGPPSAVRPRVTTAKAHSASLVTARRGQREVDAEAVVAAAVVDRGGDPHEPLTGPELDEVA